MSVPAKGAEPDGEYAHEGLAPPSEIPAKPVEKRSSSNAPSRGSAQEGLAPVKGSPVGRCMHKLSCRVHTSLSDLNAQGAMKEQML